MLTITASSDNLCWVIVLPADENSLSHSALMDRMLRKSSAIWAKRGY